MENRTPNATTVDFPLFTIALGGRDFEVQAPDLVIGYKRRNHEVQTLS